MTGQNGVGPEGRLLVEEMTSPEFASAAKRSSALILPLASVEQAGTHLPLGTDLLVAREVSELIAHRTGCLAAPAIPYGDTLELDFWAGTVNVASSVLGSYLESVTRAYLRQGFSRIIFLCTHSLNVKTADLLCRTLHAEGLSVCIIDWWKAAGDAAAGETSAAEPRGHGGEVITSVAMALFPDLVRLDAASDEDSLPALSRIAGHSVGSPFIEYGDFRDYCVSGAWGEVKATASAEKGRRWVDRAVAASARFIEGFLAGKEY